LKIIGGVHFCSLLMFTPFILRALAGLEGVGFLPQVGNHRLDETLFLNGRSIKKNG
jgi:hypothetical protein